MKGHFQALEESSDEPGVNEARGLACEFVAWQFLNNLKDSDIIEYLLVELPPRSSPTDAERGQGRRSNGRTSVQPSERSPLLPTTSDGDYFDREVPSEFRFSALTSQCENLSALEIATVSGAKKFLGQRPIQKIINGLWKGDIIFWDSLNIDTAKKPKKYNRKLADPCESFPLGVHLLCALKLWYVG